MPRGRVRRRRRGDDRQLRRRRATVAFVTAISTLLLSACTADFAHAGTYVMRNCSVPGYPNASLGPWQPATAQSNAVAVDACISGGGIGFRFEERPPEWLLADGRCSRSSGQSAARSVRFNSTSWRCGTRRDLEDQDKRYRCYGLERYADYTVSPHWLITGPPGGEHLTFERRFSRADVDAVVDPGHLRSARSGASTGSCGRNASDAHPGARPGADAEGRRATDGLTARRHAS